MSELKIQLKGWQAIVVAVVLIGVIVARFMTLNDMRNDKELMKRIDTLLMDEYSPYVAEKLRDAYNTGENRTIYYLFKHGAFGWQYQYITTSLSYYFNFI